MEPTYYFFLWIISFSILTWIIIRVLRKSYIPPNSDDEGGTPVESVLPTYDPPSGNGIDDLLVDRPPKEWLKKPNRPVNS